VTKPNASWSTCLTELTILSTFTSTKFSVSSYGDASEPLLLNLVHAVWQSALSREDDICIIILLHYVSKQKGGGGGGGEEEDLLFICDKGSQDAPIGQWICSSDLYSRDCDNCYYL
ncbi:hypothetical protein ACJX0J_027283, partial [Zea mays]